MAIATTYGSLPEAEHSAQLRKAVIASTIGTTIEWYDFFIYGTAAGLVFGKLYFPHEDPLSATLLAFGTYFIGFIGRPIGAAIFGHYGDRIGRKAMLIATLLCMGFGTFLIAFVPTYASIGIWGAITAGHLSDRIGRKNMYLIGAAAMGVFGFIYFAMIDTAIPAVIFLAIVLSLIPHDLQYGPQAALIAEAFTPRLRYSGSSLGYQLASIIAGGPAPLIATALFAAYHTGYAVAIYIAVCAVISLISTALMPRLHGQGHFGGVRFGQQAFEKIGGFPQTSLVISRQPPQHRAAPTTWIPLANCRWLLFSDRLPQSPQVRISLRWNRLKFYRADLKRFNRRPIAPH